VIQKHLVYQKTAKGSDAIANRQSGPSPRLRSMLILVDGKRGYDELSRLSQAFGHAEQLLAQLLDQGLIESAAANAPPATAAPSPAAGIPLRDAQRFAVRRLVSILGPAAEPLCLRIEATRSAQDFLSAITRAEGMIRETRGSNTASAFAAEMQDHRPAA
jgi:hypothetical protein